MAGPRKKTPAPEQRDLPVAPARPAGSAAAGIPALMEYRDEKHKELWRVERFDLLSAEFGVTAEEMPVFHGLVAEASRSAVTSGAMQFQRTWQICRRLFGIMPVLPPASASADDLRVWSRAELEDQLGITAAQLRQELAAGRALWSRQRRPEVEPVEEKPVGGELHFSDDEILQRFGFPESMFEVLGRPAAESYAEKIRFAGRVAEWSKMLEHRMAGTLARQALLNSLMLARGEVALLKINTATMTGEKDYAHKLKQQHELSNAYQAQLVALDKIFPWMGAVGDKTSFQGVVSDLVKGYREYIGDGSMALIDGMMTAAEMQVEMRQSQQIPEPRYRLGLVAHVTAARAGLFDPNWRPMFTDRQLKKLDAGFKEALMRVGEDAGEVLPDLESDRPGEGEYEPIHVPAP